MSMPVVYGIIQSADDSQKMKNGQITQPQYYSTPSMKAAQVAKCSTYILFINKTRKILNDSFLIAI